MNYLKEVELNREILKLTLANGAKRILLALSVCFNILFLALCLSLFLANKAHADELTVMGGGWSKHVGSADYIPLMNSNHELKGIGYNGFTLAQFTNSYYKKSTVVAYNHDLSSHWFNKVNIRTSLALGVITGYSKDEVAVMLTDRLSLYVLPSTSISYQLTSDMALGFTIGLIPSKEATAITTNIFMRF